MIKTTLREDRIWLTGLIFLFLSLLIFIAPLLFHFEENAGGLFVCNYGMAIAYLTILIASNRLRKGRNGLAPLFVLLLISLISCYSLNRSMNIFDESVPWWSALLIISGLNYLTLPFYQHLSRLMKYLVLFIAGISFIAFLYLAISLMPIYIISCIASFAAGISLHTFIPLLFVIYTLVFVVRAAGGHKPILIAFFAGIAITIIVILQFTIRWSAEVARVDHDLYNTPRESKLPAWVGVAQDCRPSTFNEHFLKTGIVYKASGSWDLFSWNVRHQFDEKLKHDPLITIATFFAGVSSLEDDDRIKILECLYDSRHQAQERLWRGDDLSTVNVNTTVELWPEQHLSFTQEDVTVKSNALRTNWRQEQEALYTFHLPEGATVSSLSLWIKGHEEKALLSSRHKADSAYQRVVGAERRDPSVVHWQEGDKVVVRVFPVLPQETRHFRIGITAPLDKKANRLLYHSIYFDGPSASSATASVDVQPMKPLLHADPLPTRRVGAYQPDWTIAFDDPGIADIRFQFNGQNYSTEAYVPEFAPTPIQQVYLDLNKAWTHQEFTALLPMLASKKVWAWQPNEGLVRITSKNQEDIFRSAEKLQFSLFPLTVIPDKQVSLLISKSPALSPALSDLNNTDFSKHLPQWLANPGRLCLFSIGDELSPYLKTLKECGAFRFEKGDSAMLGQRLEQQSFILSVDQPDQVLVDPADLLIRAGRYNSDTNATQGPDHLLRLFAYRRIQQQLNGQLPGDYTNEDPAAVDSLVNTAEIANIVTPVSSLVVLESDDDYKRFDITQSQNSLQNASLHGKGAVPEPAEWMLIALVLALALYLRTRSKRRRQTIPI